METYLLKQMDRRLLHCLLVLLVIIFLEKLCYHAIHWVTGILLSHNAVCIILNKPCNKVLIFVCSSKNEYLLIVLTVLGSIVTFIEPLLNKSFAYLDLYLHNQIISVFIYLEASIYVMYISCIHGF